MFQKGLFIDEPKVNLGMRRTTMIQAARVVEPNYTMTDFIGNGTTGVEVDLGISNPSIIIVYPKTPLSSGSFPNSNNNQRLFIYHDTNYNRDLYCNTRSSTSSGNYIYSSTTVRLSYENNVLDTESESVGFRADYDYRAVAIREASSDVTITELTGNGSGSITVDLGISNPSFLFVVYKNMLLGSFTSNTSTSVLGLFDHDVTTSRTYYVNGRSSTSAGYLYLGSVLSYNNGVLTVGNTTSLQNNAQYMVIAIQ